MILGNSLPLNYHPPQLKATVSPVRVRKQRPNETGTMDGAQKASERKERQITKERKTGLHL